MIFEQFQIPLHLEKYIESIMYLKDVTPYKSIERVVPTGHIYVIFEFDNIKRNIYNNETLKPIKTFSKVWVSGMHQNFLSISAHQNSEMLVIQFKPSGAFPFFNCLIQALNNNVFSAEEIFGKEILDLRIKILEIENLQSKYQLAINWLEKRFDEKKIVPDYLISFIDKLQKDPSSSLKTLTSSYPATQKQLIEHFKKYVGITPKYYHRILRFNETLKKINQNEKIDWVDIAFSCDYSDQSHFIKEFFLFSGFNPQEFIKKEFEKEQTNFFPLDRKG